MFFFSKRDPVIGDMQKTLHSLQSSDPPTLQAFDAKTTADTESILAGLPLEKKRQQAVLELQQSIAFAKNESDPDGHTYHSRDALTGITQTHLGTNNLSQQPQAVTDNVLPELQAFGQGNAG